MPDAQLVKEAMRGRYRDFYARFTTLKRIGGELRGPCPLHGGTGPNFAVNEEDGTWFCHSQCREGGDAIAFLRRLHGLDFPEAVASLAETAGFHYAPEPVTTPWKGPMSKNKAPLGRIADTYDYTDEEGNVLFQSLRFAPKDFRQRRPDGTWGLGDVRRVLYRLPAVIEAIKRKETIYVVEGEKDAESLAALGLCATCNPMGVGKWNEEYTAALSGASVVILPDNDKTGRDHAQKVAQALHGKAAKIRVVTLPNLPEKGDVSDWIEKGGTREELEALVTEATDWQPAPAPDSEANDPGEDDTETKGRPSCAQLLVEIGMRADLFHDDRDANFARFAVGDHHQVWPLRSKAFREWLSREYYTTAGRPAGGQGMEDALRVLDGYARFDGDQRPLSLRVASYADGVLLDLADAHWAAVHVTPAGWEVLPATPCLFRRYAVSAAQARPERGGRLDALRAFVNVRDETAWRQLVAWLVAALLPDIAHPILVVHGEQGSAKSTLMRLLCLLIDPSRTPLRSEPREIGEWVQAADHSWLTVLDNVSHLPSWLSDALCRAVTGEGFVKRQLYTDGEDVIVSFRRVVALTGIEVVAQRADLLDRSLLLALEPIPPARRRSETDVLREFEAARPAILGALLDTLSGVLRELPFVSLSALPRMADFARVGLAVEKVLGWPAGSFLADYGANITDQHEEALSSSPVGEALRPFMESRETWEGTAKDLLDQLNGKVGEAAARRRDWPKSPKALSGQVRRIAPNLRATGLDVAFTTPHGKRLITLTRRAGETTVPTVPPSGPISAAPQSGTQAPPAGTQPAPTGTHPETPSPSARNGRNDGNAVAPSASTEPTDDIIEVEL